MVLLPQPFAVRPPTSSGSTRPAWREDVSTECADTKEPTELLAGKGGALASPDTVHQQQDTHAREECASLWSGNTGEIIV